MVMSALLLALLAPRPQEPASPAPVAAATPPDDDRYVEIVAAPWPARAVLEVGGMCEHDGSLYVCTRRGEIWRAEDASGPRPQWSLWAEGLQEPLGLLSHGGWIWCAQRGELSRLRDTDGDGRMDDLETVAQGWPLSGNYHEYCFGPALQPDGTMWLTLNKPFGDEPFGRAKFRGWAISIPPDARPGGTDWVGECAGLRSPCGVATAPWGEVFYTDNQGEWCPSGKLSVLRRGEFHGHPWGIDSCAEPESRVAPVGEVRSGLRIAAAGQAFASLRQPAVWFPYDTLGRSPSGFAWDERGAFPPYRGQVFVGDQYSSEIMRVSLERVGGEWQGACYPFRRGLACGVTRVLFGSDGTLWCGLTNRGWGSLGNAEYGMQRLRWRGEQPFDLLEVQATENGFRLRFVGAPDPASAVPAAFAVESWTYDLHEEYGCDPRDVTPHEVRAATVDADGSVRLALGADLPTCRVYAVDCRGVRDAAGAAPWHPVAWYTRNRGP